MKSLSFWAVDLVSDMTERWVLRVSLRIVVESDGIVEV